MKAQQKRDGFYMNITSQERKIINKLQEKYAISIARAFKLFLKQLLNKMKKEHE